MKSNRRYSSNRSKSLFRTPSSSKKNRVKENPFLICISAIIAVVVAAMSGRSIDQKLTLDKGELSADNYTESYSGRAGLKRESEVGDTQEASMAKLSQAPRGPVFSRERWSSNDLYFTDDNGEESNDVSFLVSNSFSLIRSLKPGFKLQTVNLGANFKSDSSFLELESTDGRDNKLLITFLGQNINVSYRAISGELKRVASFVRPQDQCQEISVSFTGAQEISCVQSKVNLGKIPLLPITPATFTVRSHLSVTELHSLKVVGSYRGAVTEDSL